MQHPLLKSVVLASALALPLGAAHADRDRPDIDGAQERYQEELSALTSVKSRHDKDISIDAENLPQAISTAVITEIAFALDDAYYTRTYDRDVRDYVDRSVSESDRKTLSDYLRGQLKRELEDHFTLKSGDQVGDENAVFIQPVIVEVERSRPGIEQLSARPGLSMRSQSAGGAAVHFLVRTGGPDGPVVMSYLEEDNRSFNDEINRPTEWFDARRSMVFIVDNFVDALEDQGVAPADQS